jgi:hypothetical protein
VPPRMTRQRFAPAGRGASQRACRAAINAPAPGTEVSAWPGARGCALRVMFRL